MTRLRSRGTGWISLFGRIGIILLAVFFAATACRVAHGQAEPAARKILETTYLPSDASFALLVRPAELAKAKYAQPVVAAFDQLLAQVNLGTSVSGLDEFKFVILGTPMPGPPDLYMVIRGTKAIDWKTVFTATRNATEDKNVDGQVLYHLGHEAFWLPDERSVVFGTLSGVQRTMKPMDPNDRAEWSDSWEKAAKGPLAGLLHMRILEGVMAPGPNGQPKLSLAPLTENARYAVLEGHATDKGLALVATMATNSNAGSVTVAPVVARAMTNFASMIVSESGLAGNAADRLAAQLTSLLGGTQIVTQGKTVEIKALVTPKMLEVFSESAQMIGAR